MYTHTQINIKQFKSNNVQEHLSPKYLKQNYTYSLNSVRGVLVLNVLNNVRIYLLNT